MATIVTNDPAAADLVRKLQCGPDCPVCRRMPHNLAAVYCVHEFPCGPDCPACKWMLPATPSPATRIASRARLVRDVADAMGEYLAAMRKRTAALSALRTFDAEATLEQVACSMSAPLRVTAPDPQATGRVPQLAIELAAIAESIGLAVQLDDRWRESNLDGEPATSEMHEARTRLHGARGDLLALANRVQTEGSDL